MKRKIVIPAFIFLIIGVVASFALNFNKPSCPIGTTLDKELSRDSIQYCMSAKINTKSYQTEFFSSKLDQKKCVFERVLIEHCPSCVNKTKYVLTGKQECWYLNGKSFFTLETNNNRLSGKGSVWKDDGQLWFTLEKISPKDFDFKVTFGSTIDGINKDLGMALINRLMSGYAEDWKKDGDKEEVDIVKLSRLADKFSN
jgi:hypothetical protein